MLRPMWTAAPHGLRVWFFAFTLPPDDNALGALRCAEVTEVFSYERPFASKDV